MVNNKIKNLVVTSMMASLCFLGSFISIKIPLPIGTTIIHFGNIFMLVSSILFGGIRGGLSSGIGMSLYDIFSGTFISYAPGTFIIKFLSGFICGKLCKKSIYNGNKKGVIVGCIIGILVNIIGSPINTIIIKMFANNFEIMPILISAVLDLGISIINGSIAVITAIPIAFYGAKYIKYIEKL